MGTRKVEIQQNRTETDDPVLAMLGVGKELWNSEPGDSFVERLRSEDPPPKLSKGSPDTSVEALFESVWRRINSHQGEKFRTVTGLPFTYAVEGSGIWFFRDGRRINRKVTRAHVDKAITRCPLTSTTEIKDVMDYPYVFAVLMDTRIRRSDW